MDRALRPVHPCFQAMTMGARLRSWWTAFPHLRWVIVGIIALLVILRLCLPFAVEHYVNRQLNRSKTYGGRIGDVDIQLWRGQYRIHRLEIKKRAEGLTSPFFDADRLDLSVEWKELFHGSIVGQVIMQQPKLNFEIGPTPDKSQTGKEEQWNEILESLFPFKINRLEIFNGQIHFKNPHKTPVVDIYLSKVAATATNLTNTRDVKNQLPAAVSATATTIGGGGLNFQLQFNPLTDQPAFQLDTALTNVDASALNDFLRAYGKFDIRSGIFSLFTSVAGQGGNYDGYFKVFFRDLKVFDWQKDQSKSVMEIFWQAIVGTVATILKNQPHDTLAARVPITGTYSGAKVGIWSAVGTLLQNAFIQSLNPKLDEKMTIQDVGAGGESGSGKKEERRNLNPPEETTTPVKGAEMLTTNAPPETSQISSNSTPTNLAATNLPPTNSPPANHPTFPTNNITQPIP